MRRSMVILLGATTLGVAPMAGQVATRTATPEASRARVIPRTPDGTPDLQGVWNFRTATPLERPAEFADREFLSEQEVAAVERAAAGRLLADPPGAPQLNTPPQWVDSGTKVVGTRRSSLIIDPANGRLPTMTPAGLKQAAALLAEHTAMTGPESFTPWERCITRGFPAVMLPSAYNNNLQIVQTPRYVVMHTEMIHEARIVPVDGRVPALPDVRAWMGHPIGRWEGDTLVVETTSFLEQANFFGFGNRFLGAGRQLRIIERFTRTDDRTIDYRFTVDDPLTWTQPWTAAIPLVKTDEPMYEYACHEANYNLLNMLSYARQQDSSGRSGIAPARQSGPVANSPKPPGGGHRLAPTGTLRVGVYAGSPTSLVRDPATGEARGLTVDLGAEFARRLGVPFTLVEFPQIADILTALRAGDVDFTVTNASPERAKTVDFSEAILEVELGYLARERVPIATAADVDRSGIRVGVTAGSASQATLGRELRQAVLVPAPTVTAAVAMLRDGQLDAYATNKAVLFQMADQVLGSRVLEGRWGIESFAVAIPQGRREAWSTLSAFVSDARSAGVVVRAASRAGLRGIAN